MYIKCMQLCTTWGEYSDLDEEVTNVLFQLVDILIEAEHVVDKYLDLSAITDTEISINNETYSIYLKK